MMARALLAFMLLLGTAHAETKASTPLEFEDYLRRVMAANPDLQAARASVEIAEAQIRVAKVFPDPEVSLGVNQYDVTRQGNPTMAGAQVSVPVELGGKRRARVAVAQSGLAAASADYHDAIRTLRGLAADSFVDALHAAQVVEQKQKALAHLDRLVTVNQRRLAAGDISEVELLQSRVESQQFRAEVLAARGNERTA
jgi:cobalt-zinc-cadmium efflux system outer membrane protein